MNRKIMFIANPIAGKGGVSTIVLPLVDAFNKQGDEVSVFTTQHVAHATQLVEQHASRFDVVVASGGDGTLNEVVNGLMHLEERPALCYIPNGTVNDFAATLGLKKSKTFIENLVAQDYKVAIDIGQFNDEFFTYVAAFGAFTQVSYSTPQQSKNIFGKAAYFFEGVKSISSIESYTLIVESDQGIIDGAFVFGAISNSKSIAGIQFKSTVDAELDDGLFEVLLIKQPNSAIELQNIASALITQSVNENLMYYFKTSSLTIRSIEDIAWTIDGEEAMPSNHIEIKNHHKAINFFVKPEKKKEIQSKTKV